MIGLIHWLCQAFLNYNPNAVLVVNCVMNLNEQIYLYISGEVHDVKEW